MEAGAGSGKTTALVGRVVALVTSGAVELRNVAAITFTEKAGAELRDRVRRELAGARPTATGDPRPRALPRRRSTQLDGAAIGTLHSFAQRLLSEHPVEARLPPKVEVLDEVASAVAFDRRWTRVLDQLLEDPALERTILLLHAAGVDPGKLRSLALAFERSLGPRRGPRARPRPPSRRRRADLLRQGPRRSSAALRRAGGRVHRPHRQPAGSRRRLRRPTASGSAQRRRRRARPPRRLLAGAPQLPQERRHKGRRGAAARSRCTRSSRRWSTPSTRSRGSVLDGCAHRIGAALRRHTLDAADRAPRAPARLEFHDLLVLARRVLRDPVQGPIVRAAPPRALPAAAARRVPGHRPDPDRAGRAHRRRRSRRRPTRTRWADVDVAPGPAVRRGRPQAVDLPLPPGRHLHLPRRPATASRPRPAGRWSSRANFRTVAPVIDWVNATFRTLLEEAPDTDVPDPSQPAYIDLARPARRAAGRPAGGGDRRRRPTRTAPAPTRSAPPRPRRRPRRSPPRSPRAGRCRRRRRRLAAVPARRHHHPRPGPHLAAVPRGRPRGGRASPTGPSRARSSTPPGPCATC